MNLEDSVAYLSQNLDPKFVQEFSNGFRAELAKNLDIAVLCLSQYPPDAANTDYKYVVQTMAKNNTLKSLVGFDDVRDAVDVVNSQVRGF